MVSLRYAARAPVATLGSLSPGTSTRHLTYNGVSALINIIIIIIIIVIIIVVVVVIVMIIITIITIMNLLSSS